MKTKRLLHLLPVIAVWLTTAVTNQMQAATAIVLDGKFGTGGPVTGNNKVFTIPENVGRRAGNNLFHSFSQFGIGTGDTANFTGNAAIKNILTRVTGGTASQIDGRLQSSIAGANLFLMNPAGVIFGPNATINVPGNFTVTTADYIKLNDGNFFYANPTGPETLTTATVSAFGFLGASRIGTIEFNGSKITHATGESLEFYSGDIAFKGSGSGVGDGAQIVAPSGNVYVTANTISLENGATISSSSDASYVGDIKLTGTTLSLDRGSILAQAGAASSWSGGDITLSLAEGITLRNSSTVSSGTYDGAGGYVNIDAKNLSIMGNSKIESIARGSGIGGIVTVILNQDLLLDTGKIASAGVGGLAAASVAKITARDITILNGGEISAIGDAGLRHGLPAGVVQVFAGRNILIDGSGVKTGIFSTSGGGTDGGLIEITKAQQLDIRNGGQIAVTATGGGGGGSLRVDLGGDLSILDSTGVLKTGLFADRIVGSGPRPKESFRDRGGSIRVEANAIFLSGPMSSIRARADKAEISSFSGGGIDIDVRGNLEVANRATIDVQSTLGFGGDAGTISIRTPMDIHLRGNSLLSAVADHNGGNIHVYARFLDVDGSRIVANANRGVGGYIYTQGLGVFLRNGASITADSRDGQGGEASGWSQFDFVTTLAVPLVGFFRPDTRVRLECRRDQPFANTLDLSGVGSDGLYSDPILQLTPVEGLKK